MWYETTEFFLKRFSVVDNPFCIHFRFDLDGIAFCLSMPKLWTWSKRLLQILVFATRIGGRQERFQGFSRLFPFFSLDLFQFYCIVHITFISRPHGTKSTKKKIRIKNALQDSNLIGTNLCSLSRGKSFSKLVSVPPLP